MPGVKGTMKEFKAGTLHSGSKTGPKVKSRKQAIAIGLSEERGEKGPDPTPPRRDGAGRPMSKAMHKKMYSFPTKE